MPHTVLVVDDDPVMHPLMEHHLERAGYKMISAKNGREAIEMARRELPELIIMDVLMPEMGGLITLRQLKETEATNAIPVIIVTVHDDSTTQQECKLSGAAAFLIKPVSPTQLLAELRRLLPRSEADGEAGKTR
ncbi:MAG TPA: response regulator [Candidatus Acidoferrum sp.]|jgi:CheY-like chemotaxis protein|nr:response regulator [Candidatus Acidoferrum sp.]